MSSAFIARNPGVRRRACAAAAAGLAMTLAAACGGGGASPAVDAGSAGQGGGSGGPIDPGGDGGWPRLVAAGCPTLTMPTAAAGIVYVDGGATGAESGSVEAPFRTIATALASVGQNGSVWVAAGTYAENLTVPETDVVLYGGFAAGFSARTDACATILEAGDAARPVLTASASVKSFGLDGVTVRGGARGLSVAGEASVGARFSIASAVFSDDGAPDAVGGALFLDRVSATITRSVFRDNRAEKGAAIAQGGDDTTIAIEDSVFERNVGHSDHGGALYLSPGSATIVRNTFRGNEIGKTAGYGWGGAVIVYKAGAAPVHADFAYNVFTDNLASVGGAVFVDDGASATLSHDLLYRNRSIKENGVARGGAIYVDGLDGPGTGSSLVADHVAVVNNAYDEARAPAQSRGGGVYLETYSSATFTSSIFWGNGDEALFGDPTTSIAVKYSIAPSACSGVRTCAIGEGVLQPADVLFADEAADDYHEKSAAGRFSNRTGTFVNDDATSPAIDKADPAEGPGPEPEPNGGRANLGAYGRTAEASKSP